MPEMDCWSCDICVHKFPEDGTPVPKYAGLCTYHKLCFTNCVLLYFIKCMFWLIF